MARKSRDEDTAPEPAIKPLLAGTEDGSGPTFRKGAWKARIPILLFNAAASAAIFLTVREIKRRRALTGQD